MLTFPNPIHYLKFYNFQKKTSDTLFPYLQFVVNVILFMNVFFKISQFWIYDFYVKDLKKLTTM